MVGGVKKPGEITSLPELYLQRLVRLLFSDPEKLWKTVNHQHFQILSPGEWNFDEGPDFRNMAVILNNHVEIGDAEVHRYRSEWEKHQHWKNKLYRNTLFHVFFVDDGIPVNEPIYPIHISSKEFQSAYQKDQQLLQQQQQTDLASLEILQEFAYRRIVRKSEELWEDIKYHRDLLLLLKAKIAQFFHRHSRAKRRPKGMLKHAQSILQSQKLEAWAVLLQQIRNQENISDVPALLQNLRQTPLAEEGKATRMELLINVFFPMAYALAEPATQHQLLLWFWTQPAPHRYGKLSRQFPKLPQQYVWQQQGMLEYLRECRLGKERCAELLLPYIVCQNPKTFENLTAEDLD